MCGIALIYVPFGIIGVNSITAKGKLSILDLYVLCLDKKGARSAFTISAHELCINSTIKAEKLTLKGDGKEGSAFTYVHNGLTVESITGFRTVTLNNELRVRKTLTADDIILDNAKLYVTDSATITANKTIVCKNNSVIDLREFKPVVIGKNTFDTANSSILDGQQIFTLPSTRKKSDDPAASGKVDEFLAKVDYSGLTSGTYNYELEFKSGKVTLAGYFLKLEETGKQGDQTFASWTDVITYIKAIPHK